MTERGHQLPLTAAISSALMISILATPAVACMQLGQVNEREARALLKQRTSGGDDPMILFDGRSPGPRIAMACGLIGVGKRGMPDRFVIRSRVEHGGIKRELLLKSDPKQLQAFGRAWVEAGCDKGRPR